MNIFLNEYFGFCFELNHFSARFNEKMNFQNVSYRAILRRKGFDGRVTTINLSKIHWLVQSSVNALQERVKQTQDVSMLQEMADKRRIS